MFARHWRKLSAMFCGVVGQEGEGGRGLREAQEEANDMSWQEQLHGASSPLPRPFADGNASAKRLRKGDDGGSIGARDGITHLYHPFGFLARPWRGREAAGVVLDSAENGRLR